MENVNPYIELVVHCIDNYIFKISFPILSIKNRRYFRDISYKRWAAGELKQLIQNECVCSDQVRKVIHTFIKKLEPMTYGAKRFDEFTHVMYMACETAKEIREILINKNYI